MDIYLDFNTEGEFLVTPTGPVLKFPGFVSDEEAPTAIRVNIEYGKGWAHEAQS